MLTMALGGVTGFLLRRYRMVLLTPTIQVVIYLLLFFLGLELSSDRALLGIIGHLGLQAGAITLGALLGSLLMAYGIYHLFFKQFDKKSDEKQRESKGWAFLKSSAAIFISFLCGMACGGFNLFTASLLTTTTVLILLYTLLFFVGITVGKDTTLFSLVRQQGYRFLLLPLGTLSGTLAGADLAG